MDVVAEPVLGRRERKKLETRQSLEDAALRLFVEQGYDKTTVEDITEAADVSPRTFFRYFDSKESVLFSSAVQMGAALRDALEQRPPDERPLTGIRAAFRVLAGLQEEDRDHTLIRARISMDAPEVQGRAAQVSREWEEILAAWLVSRLPADSSPLLPGLLAGACMAALRSALAEWIVSSGTGEPGDLVDDALDLLQNGLIETG